MLRKVRIGDASLGRLRRRGPRHRPRRRRRPRHLARAARRDELREARRRRPPARHGAEVPCGRPERLADGVLLRRRAARCGGERRRERGARAAFLRSAAAVRAEIAQLRTRSLTVVERAQLDRVARDVDGFMQVDARVIAGYRTGDAASAQAANRLVLGEELTRFAALTRDADALAAALTKRAGHVLAHARSMSTIAIVAITAVAFAGIAGIAALAVFLTRSVTRPLDGLVGFARRIASGDLVLRKGRRDGAKDEIADVEDGFQTTLERLRDAIVGIQGASAGLAAAAEEVAASAEEVGASLGEVTTAIGEVSRGADEQTGLVDAITAIASQTNLLALNAAIEAARAGEHRRGFAVVADEVRQLAEECQRAAGSIGTIVSEIQSATGEVVDLVDETSVRVEANAEAVARSRAAFEHIATAATSVEGSIGGVASVSQSTSTQAVTVSERSQRASQSAVEIAAAAETVAATAEHLQGLVDHFRTS